MTSILGVVAHPDDFEINCGGTVAKWVFKDNLDVTVLVCSSGEKGNRREITINPYLLGELREREQSRAASILGIKKVIFLRYPDGGINNDRALRAEIAYLIRICKPEIVLTHDPWRFLQLHPDHRNVGFSVIDAIGMAREFNFLPVLDATGIQPFAPSELWLFRTDHPNHIEDISLWINKKLDAMKCFESQLTPWKDWEQKTEERGKEAGKMANIEYGEPFNIFHF